MSFPGLIIASLPYVPPPYDPDFGWDGLAITWTGSNGITWNLSAPELGIILGRGVRGLGMPTIAHQRDKSPARAGSYWRGYTTEERSIFLPLRLFHDGSTAEFVDLWNAFWDGMDPATPGTLTVRGPGGVRTIRARYDKGGEEAYDMDPTFFGWAQFGLELVAEQPFWQGDTVSQDWVTLEPVDFFDPAGSAPFYISEGTSASSAVVTNPGHEPAYPVFTAYGPFTKLDIVYQGRRITVPFTLAAGRALVIDTRPETASVTDNNGVDRWSEMSAWGFSPIAPGINQKITVTITGTGSLSMYLEPLYRRAF